MRIMHKAANLRVQEQHARKALAAYLRDLRDCGYIIEGDEVRPPMCMPGALSENVAWNTLTRNGDVYNA